MKKNLLVAIVVILLLLSVISFAFYLSTKSISKKSIEYQTHNADLIINQQVTEAITFADRAIKIALVESLNNNQCNVQSISKIQELQSKYANFKIEGEPDSHNINNPYANSGCLVKITYGQGTRSDYAKEIRDKVLYLSLTNGGNFIIDPNKTTLEKKYWPSNNIKNNIK